MPTRRYKFLWAMIMLTFFGFLFHHMRDWFTASTAPQATQSQPIKQAKPHYTPPPIQTNRTVSVQLTTATTNANPFLFYADKTKVTIHLGEPTTVYFYVKNLSDKAQHFRAIPHVAPKAVATYFERTQGFGVKTFVIESGKVMRLPVSFYIDTHLPQSVSHLTLNYTLFLL